MPTHSKMQKASTRCDYFPHLFFPLPFSSFFYQLLVQPTTFQHKPVCTYTESHTHLSGNIIPDLKRHDSMKEIKEYGARDLDLPLFTSAVLEHGKLPVAPPFFKCWRTSKSRGFGRRGAEEILYVYVQSGEGKKFFVFFKISVRASNCR